MTLANDDPYADFLRQIRDDGQGSGVTDRQVEDAFERWAAKHPHWSPEGKSAWRVDFYRRAYSVLSDLVPDGYAIAPPWVVDAIKLAVRDLELLSIRSGWDRHHLESGRALRAWLTALPPARDEGPDAASTQ